MPTNQPPLICLSPLPAIFGRQPSLNTSACSLLSELWIRSVEGAMSQRVHKYGMWCDVNYQALDTFRVDEWSRSDAFLLAIMCVLAG